MAPFNALRAHNSEQHVNNRVIFLPFFCALFWAVQAQAIEQEKFVYVSYAVPESYHHGRDSFTIDLSLKATYADHGIQRLHICQPDESYYCIYSTSFNFSIPKQGITVGDHWSTNDYNFKVLREETIELLGRKVLTYVISSCIEHGRTDHYYFSDQSGLVGIKFGAFDEHPARFLVLTQKNGYLGKGDRKKIQ